jgi:DNA (cytosine-5)-methyltransferase 1
VAAVQLDAECRGDTGEEVAITCGSLFSGIGGFDLAFQRAGIETIWQVEIDEKCLNILVRHFPNAERYTDVRTVGKQNLTPVDVICGGFPCQDLSVAGKRAGLAGERSGLWHEFHRIISELEPRWVVIENVPGLLRAGRLWRIASTPI